MIRKPYLNRLFGRESSCAKDHLTRETFTDDAREILRGSNRWTRPYSRPCLSEHGVFRSDDNVAPQREFIASTHAPAIDHRYHGNRHAPDRGGAPEHALIPMRARYPVEAFHGREITAGAEGPVTYSCDHYTSDRWIVSSRENRTGNLVKRQFTASVQGVWSIDGYPSDLVAHFEENVFVFWVSIDFGHCRKSTL
jgi:hypothetical protein